MATPSCFVIMPYKEPYEGLYSQVIKAVAKECGFNLVRADKIVGSRPFIQDIEQQIKSADVVIADLSEANMNVYYELGIAQAMRKDLVLLVQDPDGLPSDTRHVRHLVYSVDEREKLKKDLKDWLVDTRAYQLKLRKEPSKVLNRGDLFDRIADATIYINTSIGDPKRDIVNYVANGKLIPPAYLYMFDRGVALWLELCNDAEYHYYKNSIDFFNKNADLILDSMGDDIVARYPDFISLGPGNGQKDRIFLGKIVDRQKGGEDMYYYPFDISPNMISRAITVVTGSRKIYEKIKIKAIASDFGTLKSFSPVYQYRTEPNIFMLLGNTLGNVDHETNFLDQIHQAMFPGDILVIEVRLKTKGEIDIGGSIEINKKFDFTPLDVVGVVFDENRLNYQICGDRSSIPNTTTVVATYNDFSFPWEEERYEKAYLSYIHEYDYDSLTAVIERVGFEIMKKLEWPGIGCFVLKKVAK